MQETGDKKESVLNEAAQALFALEDRAQILATLESYGQQLCGPEFQITQDDSARFPLPGGTEGSFLPVFPTTQDMCSSWFSSPPRPSKYRT